MYVLSDVFVTKKLRLEKRARRGWEGITINGTIKAVLLPELEIIHGVWKGAMIKGGGEGE